MTAGPTREFFDPVRFLSNPSSGKMGYAIAEEAGRRGAKETLVSGPTSLGSRLKIIPVVSARDMYRAVMKEASKADLVVMAAAVSDFRPATYLPRKLKKTGRSLTVRFVPNPDILKELGRRKQPGQILVGFAAETDHLMENARRKIVSKNLNMIVVNRVGGAGSGFEGNKNQATILMKYGTAKRLPLMKKTSLASAILGYAVKAGR